MALALPDSTPKHPVSKMDATYANHLGDINMHLGLSAQAEKDYREVTENYQLALSIFRQNSSAYLKTKKSQEWHFLQMVHFFVQCHLFVNKDTERFLAASLCL